MPVSEMPKLVICISEISEFEFDLEIEYENIDAEACYRFAGAIKGQAVEKLMKMYARLKTQPEGITSKRIEALVQHRDMLQQKVDTGNLSLGEMKELGIQIVSLTDKIKKLSSLRNRIIADKGEELKRVVAQIYSVAVDDVISSKRTAPLPECRQLIAYFLQDILNRNEIAEILQFDRTSLYYAIESFEDALNYKPQTRQRYDEVLKQLKR